MKKLKAVSDGLVAFGVSGLILDAMGANKECVLDTNFMLAILFAACTVLGIVIQIKYK